MKDIVTRTLYGVVFVAVVIGSILLHPFAFLTVIGIAVIIATYEFLKLFFPDENILKHLPYFLFSFLTYLIIALIGLHILSVKNIVYLIVVPFILIAFELFRSEGASWHHLTVYSAGLFYYVIPFGIMNTLYYAKNNAIAFPVMLIAMFVLVWANDVFAYLTGSFFGKHKLFEKVSPKKTWEGSIGGFFFTLLFSCLIFYFVHEMNLRDWLSLAVIVSITGTIGDLAESLLKRNTGVKDTGTLIPGHGGILDRFDAAIFATPFVYLYFNFI